MLLRIFGLLGFVIAGALVPFTASADDLMATPGPQSLSGVVLVAPKANISAQVARTEAQREQGLMFYRSLPPHHGMIFVFAVSGPQTFWMKNTLIPLDMVFIAPDGKVNVVAAHVPATSATTPGERTTRAGAGAFVLEINSGEAARDGITVGSYLKIPPLTAAP